MRAAVVREFGKAPRVEDVPLPVPTGDEVRVKVEACGVDRFDVDIAAGTRPWAKTPLILGHEIAGVVSATGSVATGWHIGDRVVPSLYLVCGDCARCRDARETICERFRGHIGLDVPGGYAEEVIVPARNLVRLPDEIEFDAGALLANVVGTALHALDTRMRLGAGERLIITGAGGGVGLHAIQVALALGAEVMAVDQHRSRLERASELGAAVAVPTASQSVVEAAHGWTGGRGVDAVLELVGPSTMSETLAAMRKGGRMVIVGSHSGDSWSVDPHVFYRNEWEIRGSRNASVTDVGKAVALVRSGAVRPIVDRMFTLDEVAVAFERLTSGTVVGRDVLVPYRAA